MDLKLVKTKDINALRKDLRDIKRTNEELQEMWLNTEEAAAFLKVHKKTLKSYRDKGKVQYSKDGRKVRYKKTDLIKYLNNYYFSIDNL